MTRNLAGAVSRRAGGRCEYCHLPDAVCPWPFHTDHIIARQHGGTTVLENLALACLHCNRHKGPNIAGSDPLTGEVIRLFHPKAGSLDRPFRVARSHSHGKDGHRRVTIRVLLINDPDFVAVREPLMQERAFPFDEMQPRH